MKGRQAEPLHSSKARMVAVYGGVASVLGAFALASACGDSSPSSPEDGGASAEAAVSDASIDHVRIPFDAGAPVGPPRVKVSAETDDRRVQVEDLMFAAGEMQISGEPFASGFAGRNLNDYDRTALPPNLYILKQGTEDEEDIVDLFGFGTAVESYEYSKYHMLQTALQSTAGVSLARGPLVAKLPGATALDQMRAQGIIMLGPAGADIAGLAVLPPPANNDQNYFGFRGLWPAFLPYKSFLPDIEPSSQVVRSCAFAGGYGGIPSIGNSIPEYECTYNQMHLLDRDAQVEKVLVPSAIGFGVWKQALWSIDFVGRLHDSQSNEVTAVADKDRAQVGVTANTVVGTDPPGAANGTYIGSTPLEGSWGLSMMTNMDNAAEYLATSFITSDGTTLASPFATRADAIAYDYSSKLVWFPAAASVTEDGTDLVALVDGGPDPASNDPFPAVTSVTITDAHSRSRDLAALLLGHAMFFGMSDPRNAGIGQRIGLQLVFDGAPFAADNGLPDGEDTAHDRALAVIRIAFVDLDRIHRDPKLHVFHDSAQMDNAGNITRGGVASTTEVAHTIIAMRQALLSLNGAISQYGGADPPPEADAQGILNTLAIHPPDGLETMSGRIRRLITENATFVRDVLTKADGSVANSATLSASGALADTSPTTLEAQTAAVRALTEGFLVTRDETFRTRARAVATKLDQSFYSLTARMYRAQAGGADDIHMTAWRFGWLLSSLRETYKVLSIDGDATLDRTLLEDRIARTIKLYLNGWDDLNGDQLIDLKTECLGARMQLGEQPLTGELGWNEMGLTSDRDSDCVLEIDDAKSSSVLAGSVHFHAP
jgi:hypothetical protein